MVSDKTTAPRLFDEGQGPWLDTITRAMLLDGVFQTLLDRDIVGMTRTPRSVPTAIDGADADDGERQRLVSEGTSAGVAAPVPAPPVGAGAPVWSGCWSAATASRAPAPASTPRRSRSRR